MSDVDVSLAALLDAEGVPIRQWESSVRGGPGHAISGGRTMIERASAAVSRAIFRVLELPFDAEEERLVEVAHELGAPLIAGWVSGGASPIGKLYLNGSDLPATARERAAHSLGWPALGRWRTPPHLIAVNVSRDGVERKAYAQYGDETSIDIAARNEHARWLLDWCRPRELSAGLVLSYEIGPGGLATERALFVAVRGGEGDGRALVGALPGWDEDAVARGLPFMRGQCRSIGVDLRSDTLVWTAYFKPAGHADALYALEPVARVAWRDTIVAVHIEPVEHAARALARTRKHAISLRGEAGLPPEVTRALARWIVACVTAAEDDGQPLELALATPPPPFRRGS